MSHRPFSAEATLNANAWLRRNFRGFGWKAAAPVVALVLAAPLTSPWASARATSTGSLTIQPPIPGQTSLTYNTKRGATAAGSFIVRNPTSRRLPVTLYGVDASVSGKSRLFTVGAKDAPRTAVGSWLRLPTSRLSLEPLGQRRLRFVLTVPLHTRPGKYAGAIIAEGPPSRAVDPRPGESGGERLLIVERVGLRVYVDVPADATAALRLGDLRLERSGWATSTPLKLLGLRWGRRVTVRALVSNAGDQPRRGLTARVDILHEGAPVSSTRPQAVEEVAPHQSRQVSVGARYSGWARGGYRARLVVSDGESQLRSERDVTQAPRGVNPLNLLAIVALLTLIVVARRYKRRGSF